MFTRHEAETKEWVRAKFARSGADMKEWVMAKLRPLYWLHGVTIVMLTIIMTKLFL